MARTPAALHAEMTSTEVTGDIAKAAPEDIAREASEGVRTVPAPMRACGWAATRAAIIAGADGVVKVISRDVMPAAMAVWAQRRALGALVERMQRTRDDWRRAARVLERDCEGVGEDGFSESEAGKWARWRVARGAWSWAG